MPTGRPRIVLVAVPDGFESRLVSALDDAGFDTVRTDSVGECLARVADGDVDGVVSGYDLPALDGVRLLRSVRVSHPPLPFVLTTPDAPGSVVDAALDVGVSGCVPTDGDPQVVVDYLQAGLERAGPLLADEHLRRYRHLIEMSPAPINLFDETGESIWCNEATIELLGLDGRDDLIGRSIFEFIHPEDHELARRELQSVVEEKESVGPTHMRLRRADGEGRPVQVAKTSGRPSSSTSPRSARHRRRSATNASSSTRRSTLSKTCSTSSTPRGRSSGGTPH
mgnify:CR=1 FL=1